MRAKRGRRMAAAEETRKGDVGVSQDAHELVGAQLDALLLEVRSGADPRRAAASAASALRSQAISHRFPGAEDGGDGPEESSRMHHVWQQAMDEGIETRAASASRERLLASIDACLMDSEAALASSLARVPGSSGGGAAGGGARHPVPKKTNTCPVEAAGSRGGSCDAIARAADKQTEHVFGQGKGAGICAEPRGGHGSLVTYCFADERCIDGAFAPDVAAREGGRDSGFVQANAQEDEVRFAPVCCVCVCVCVCVCYVYINSCMFVFVYI